MGTVISIAVVVVGIVLYWELTVPALGMSADDIKADPTLEGTFALAHTINWILALIGLALVLTTGNAIGAVLLLLGIATGAWMELVQGHEGAP